MIGTTDASESDEVVAFIAQRRGPVLRDSTDQLAAASVADLPDVVHRLHGILGSYGLDQAHDLVAALAAGLADGLDDDAADAARGDTVDALRALIEDGGA